jgi:hypothetical protein
LVSVEDLEAARVIEADAGRARQASHETRERVTRPYVLRGRLYCGFCDRRMQGQYNHGVAYYRCRYPKEYALAAHVRHPATRRLRDATSAEKTAIYDQLGLKITFKPGDAKIRAEVTIGPEKYVEHAEQCGIRVVSEVGLEPNAYASVLSSEFAIGASEHRAGRTGRSSV